MGLGLFFASGTLHVRTLKLNNMNAESEDG